MLNIKEIRITLLAFSIHVYVYTHDFSDRHDIVFTKTLYRPFISLWNSLNTFHITSIRTWLHFLLWYFSFMDPKVFSRHLVTTVWSFLTLVPQLLRPSFTFWTPEGVSGRVPPPQPPVSRTSKETITSTFPFRPRCHYPVIIPLISSITLLQEEVDGS